MIDKKYIDLISLKVCKEKEINYVPRESIRSPYVAIDIAKQLIGESDRECFMVFSLNTLNEINAVEICSIGILNSTMVHAREVFKHAILSNAAKIMLIHNHPSGSLQPSNEDIVTTEKLASAGKILGIDVLDHLIIGSNDFFSFAGEGWLLNGVFKV